MLHLGELPLRGAARQREGGGCLGGARAARGCSIGGGRMLRLGDRGSSRCAGLLDREREEAALGGAPAARGCSIRRKEEAASSGELPLRGAAGMGEGGG